MLWIFGDGQEAVCGGAGEGEVGRWDGGVGDVELVKWRMILFREILYLLGIIIIVTNNNIIAVSCLKQFFKIDLVNFSVEIAFF